MKSNSRMFNLVQRHQHAFPGYIATLLGAGIGMLGCVALNKSINDNVLKNCNQNLNQIVYIKTAVGDSYGCVSRMVLNGPPAPIKP